jgi:hypothetical protein
MTVLGAARWRFIFLVMAKELNLVEVHMNVGHGDVNCEHFLQSFL